MKKYVLIVICAVLFASCGKSMDYYYLTNTIKQLTPYQLRDSERFINGNGDMVTLTVKSIEDEWYCETEGAFVEWGACFQYRDVRLLSEDGRDGISLWISEWDWPYEHQPKIRLTFYPFNKQVTIWFDLSGNFTNAHVYDSIPIGGQMYYEVVETQIVYEPLHSNKVDTLHCYYSKTHGVLHVRENDRLILERLP